MVIGIVFDKFGKHSEIMMAFRNIELARKDAVALILVNDGIVDCFP